MPTFLARCARPGKPEPTCCSCLPTTGRRLTRYHTQVATFRAIENGFSLVRQASKGLSMAVDYEGHVLSASDYFTTDHQVMVAYVPMHGVRTIYATIGDLFAWLCMIGLVALTGLAIMQSRKRRSAASQRTSARTTTDSLNNTIGKVRLSPTASPSSSPRASARSSYHSRVRRVPNG